LLNLDAIIIMASTSADLAIIIISQHEEERVYKLVLHSREALNRVEELPIRCGIPTLMLSYPARVLGSCPGN
jgi:hypothetical protein